VAGIVAQTFTPKNPVITPRNRRQTSDAKSSPQSGVLGPGEHSGQFAKEKAKDTAKRAVMARWKSGP
jgi:phage gp16-like protein